MYTWIPKTKPVFFPNENPFMKTHMNLVCECMWYLSNPATNLSFTFYLKTNLTKTNLDTSLLLKGFTWSLHLLLDLVQTLIQRARLLLSTWCGLDAQALKSTRASSKTWLYKSILYILSENKSWHLQNPTQVFWKSSLKNLLLLLDLVQTLIQWARLLLSTWCDLDA